MQRLTFRAISHMIYDIALLNDLMISITYIRDATDLLAIIHKYRATIQYRK